MKYLSKVDDVLVCSHPQVKELKQFGSCSEDSPMYYNIETHLKDETVIRIMGASSKDCIEYLDKILQSL